MEIVITDTNFQHHTEPHDDVDGKRSKGMIPRDYTKYPMGYYPRERGMHAVDMPMINSSDFPMLIKELQDSKTRLSDIRNLGNNGQPIPSRDQNGKGYCWFHSGTSAMLLVRARDNMPYVDLSAYAGACKIKNFQDEGGWGAQGLDFQSETGIPSSQFWPQQSMSRSNDKPETWENAKKHRFTEGWIDMAAPQYDRKLSFNQVITCLLCRVPVISDFNWWGHSVCAMDAVNGAAQWGITRCQDSGKLLDLAAFEAFWGMTNPITTGLSIRIWNSWGDSWSENGTGVLTGSKAIPDSATAPRVTTWSEV